jgi:hypothetical protein
MIRMGTDLDGDGRVDRWDRNQKLSRAAEKSERETPPAEEKPAGPGQQKSGG